MVETTVILIINSLRKSMKPLKLFLNLNFKNSPDILVNKSSDDVMFEHFTDSVDANTFLSMTFILYQDQVPLKAEGYRIKVDVNTFFYQCCSSCTRAKCHSQ